MRRADPAFFADPRPGVPARVTQQARHSFRPAVRAAEGLVVVVGLAAEGLVVVVGLAAEAAVAAAAALSYFNP
jgi:hypothetical protein